MPEIPSALNSLYKQAEAAVASLLSQTQFLFEVTDQPKGTFKVVHWQGTEKISTSYRYTLNLITHGIVDETQILGNDSRLSINREGKMRVIHGQVCEICHLGALVADHTEEYQVVFESPLSRLNLNRQSRVFLNLDLKSVIEQILLTAGFAATSFKIDLKNAYTVREYIAQYNETDFNFFSRLLEQVGVFYTFVQQDAQALLLIQDDSTGLASLTLPGLTNSAALIYMPVSGQLEDEETVYLLQKFMHYFPRKDKRHDYNFRTAKQAEDEQLARLQQQVIDCQRSLYVAETNCRGISAGSTLSMSGHPQKGNNGDYLVVVVRQQGDQAQAFVFDDSRIAVSSFKTQQNPKRYHNELILLKKDIPYRPPLDYDLIPEIRGVYRARIATPGSECAYLDESGRYRLKKPVDTTDTQEGEACHAANEMQDSAGSHFTLHAGTVVRLSCRGGDPDWPVIWA